MLAVYYLSALAYACRVRAGGGGGGGLPPCLDAALGRHGCNCSGGRLGACSFFNVPGLSQSIDRVEWKPFHVFQLL